MNKTNNDLRLTQTVDRIDGAYAKATIRAYKADFSDFIKFCEENQLKALPASSIAISGYINHLLNKGNSSASIRRAVAAIATIHNLNEYNNPTLRPEVKIEMKRMHRRIGRYSNQAEAITKEILHDMLDTLKDNELRSLRDMAILLIAYDTMCRRSELVNIEISDINERIVDRKNNTYTTVILLRKSKTDQEAHGRWMTISSEASKALEKWIKHSNVSDGKVFRGIDRSNRPTKQLTSAHISRIYKKIAAQAGFDEDFVKRISGHSTRIGAAQDLLMSGASLAMIMTKGRWLKSDTVMRYVEKIGIPI